jgi:four helix bundle protein
MTIRSHRDLLVWQKAMDLVVTCYRLTDAFPKHEIYALTSQLRRAAVSVPSSIAEGRGRYSKKEFAQYLSIALGSIAELETQLEIGVRLGYLDRQAAAEASEKAEEVGKMLNGLRTSLKRKVGNEVTPRTSPMNDIFSSA